ncbi:MAG TPA: hypothetical protein PKJ16_11175 [Spirochaetota bacterium]|nr:hypothetical protein [Spirochaetota bacterium]HPU89054.1 hypothetical protein [Spirochaetota bacterium]
MTNTITLADRKTRKEYPVDIFVPATLAVLLAERLDILRKALAGTVDDSVLELVFQVEEMIFKPQYDFMTAAWCEKNVDLATTLYLIWRISKPLLEYLDAVGVFPFKPVEV